MKKILLIYLMASISMLAQNTLNVNSRIDTNNVLIGERILYTIETEFNKNLNPIIPQYQDTIGKLEIIESVTSDTNFTGDLIKIRNSYFISSFDDGEFEIPPATIVYQREGFDEPNTKSTNPIPVNFQTVEIDTSQAIKDIKAPMDAPFTLMEIMTYLLIALVVIVAGVLLFIYFKNRKKEEKPQPKYDPKIPAHVMAIEALKKLEEEKLWQNDKVKEYYVRYTEIIKIYIERRWHFNAPDMTSGEVIYNLTQRSREKEIIEILDKTFKLADLAKFAKYRPIAQENEDAMSFAYEFVDKTKDIHTPGKTEEEK